MSTTTTKPTTDVHLDNVRAAAFAAHDAGMCAIPAAEDGSKRPISTWKQHQSHRPSVEQINAWFGDDTAQGFGVVCGRVSGGLEMLELEDKATADTYLEAVRACGLGDLFTSIMDGYLERTPGGGYHLLYRCDAVRGNIKLARRPKRPDEQRDEHDLIKTLAETRGEGGFGILAPSGGRVHPTGRSYRRLRGGFERIVTITPDERDELLDVARSLDQMPTSTEARSETVAASNGTGQRPGDLFNQKATWRDLLEPRGWTFVYNRGGVDYWRRPGKDRGVSASSGYAGTDLFYAFTSSTPFEPERGYSLFSAYALLEHDGDYAAAAQALANLGYRSEHPTPGGFPLPPSQEQRTWPTPGPSLIVTSMDKVEPKPIDWIWERWLARGKLHIIGGHIGDGKSTLLAALAAECSRVGELPDGMIAPRARWLFLLAEDALDDTFRPRLDVHQADPTEVFAIQAVRDEKGADRLFNIADHLPMLEEAIVRLKITVLVVDPVTSFMPQSDRNAEGSVRDILTPLGKLAERTGVAVIAVMHVGKPTSTNRRPVQQLLGATAFGAIARVVWMVAPVPTTMMRTVVACSRL